MIFYSAKEAIRLLESNLKLKTNMFMKILKYSVFKIFPGFNLEQFSDRDSKFQMTSLQNINKSFIFSI